MVNISGMKNIIYMFKPIDNNTGQMLQLNFFHDQISIIAISPDSNEALKHLISTLI